MLLPMALMDQLNASQKAALLLHELTPGVARKEPHEETGRQQQPGDGEPRQTDSLVSGLRPGQRNSRRTAIEVGADPQPNAGSV